MISRAGELERPAAEPGAPRDSGRFHLLQAIQDAVCWRTGRLAEQCADCATVAEGRCDDHACDLRLIAAYQRTARQLERL
jgi:hypothetical protein